MMCDFYRFLTQSQGTMGIVTWASVRCELAHQAHKCFFVPAETEKRENDKSDKKEQRQEQTMSSKE